MRNAALILGIIAGLMGMFVGLFGYGYAELSQQHTEVGEIFGVFQNPGFIRFASFLAPFFALSRVPMSLFRPLCAAFLLLFAPPLFFSSEKH